MINRKHCSGCRDDFYNARGGCWSLESAKLVTRIPVGMWESPPYKNKKKEKVPNCWHGEGPHRTIYVDPEVLDSNGYWK